MKIFCSLTTIVCLWFIFSEVKDYIWNMFCIVRKFI